MNQEEAVRYYQRAADLGSPEGQRAMAFLHDVGRGVTLSPSKVGFRRL